MKCALISTTDRRRGIRRVGDVPTGHVVSKNLFAIEVDNHAIISYHRQLQRSDGRSVPKIENMTKVVRLILIARIAAETNHSLLIILRAIGVVTQLGGPAFPRGIIKGQLTPANSLISAIVQIFPN